jgi:hypothetical protein
MKPLLPSPVLLVVLISALASACSAADGSSIGDADHAAKGGSSSSTSGGATGASGASGGEGEGNGASTSSTSSGGGGGPRDAGTRGLDASASGNRPEDCARGYQQAFQCTNGVCECTANGTQPNGTRVTAGSACASIPDCRLACFVCQ